MPKFTQQEAREMYDALVEIHDTLTDKHDNSGGILKLGQYEMGWLIGIGEILKKIDDPNSED